LTTQQLKIKNPKLILKKQIENAYKYAKDVFNSDLLNQRAIRRNLKLKQNITILPVGDVFRHYKIIKNIKNPVTIQIFQEGELKKSLL